jgi:uncharacterized protein
MLVCQMQASRDIATPFKLVSRMVWLVLIAAGFAAGIINSIAGGGSFLTFPALVFGGVPAVAANASSTVALVPAALSSGFAFRKDIEQLNEPRLTAWFLISLLGGLLGASLLLVTSDRTFRIIAPWLLLFATVVFAFGRSISDAMRGRLHGSQLSMLCLLFPIAVYGGYFGGGIGIMMLAAFRLYGITDMLAMNGLKTLLAGTLNAIAAVIFIAAHQVWWMQALTMMAAGIAGGFVGPFLARRLSQNVIRVIVIVVGVLMTAWFFHQMP